MPTLTSSALLSKAYSRGDFSFRSLATDLKEKHSIHIDHKTIRNYVLGLTRPKESNYKMIAVAAFKSRKERDEYVKRWQKETEKVDRQSRRQREAWEIINKARGKRVFATTLVTRGGKFDDQHKLKASKDEPDTLPVYKPKVRASVFVKRKKKVTVNDKTFDHTQEIIEIHSDGSISLHCATWSDQRKKKYYVDEDMVSIMKILREFCTKEDLEPRGLLEIAKKELEESVWLDPATHGEGKRVLIDVYTLMDTQAFLHRAAEALRKGEKSEEQADRFDFWAGNLQGYLQPELLIGFKEEIAKTLNTLLSRFTT